MSNQPISSDLGLSLTGMRIAPRDPNTKVAKVGIKNSVHHELDGNLAASQNQRILKERTGFSGGFKIPEEYRKSKMAKSQKKKNQNEDEDFEATNASHITKDEIFQSLNLGHSDSGLGVGRHGAHSKAALTKDVVEGIEKDLEKLKRQKENLLLRKQLAVTGQKSIVEETEAEKQKGISFQMRNELETDGAFVIAASPKKLQVMRHQASQLQSTANLTLEELEEQRMANEKRLKELEEIYMSKRQNSSVGRIIRENMGYPERKSINTSPRQYEADDRSDRIKAESPHRVSEGGYFGKQNKSKKKKSVRIMEENSDLEDNAQFGSKNYRDNFMSDNLRSDEDNVFSNNLNKQSTSQRQKQVGSQYAQFGSSQGPRERSNSKGRGSDHKLGASKSRSPASRSRQQLRDPSPSSYQPQKYMSPRRKLYEAKFEKYMANKENKKVVEKKLETMAKEDFDRFTKNEESPSKQTYRYTQAEMQRSGKKQHYDPEELVPSALDQAILDKEQKKRDLQKQKKDQFGQYGVSNEDKMTYFLLKWIFNAIKRDSTLEDPKLNGRSYITKNDLSKQLAKNDELMYQLGYDDARDIAEAIRKQGSTKDGCLVWEEFLDFYFLKDAPLQQRIDGHEGWWRKIGKEEPEQNEAIKASDLVSPNKFEKDRASQNQSSAIPRYGGVGSNSKAQSNNFGAKYDDPDKKPVKMTPQISLLENTRKQKLEKEVEDEYKILKDKKENRSAKKLQSPSRGDQASNTKGSKLRAYGASAYENENDVSSDVLGMKREKSQCLLLNSQIHVMQAIYEALDKYNDKILRRSEYIMKLRTDEQVVEFIDIDAVKLANSTRILTLDEIFSEIEKDEVYEMIQMGKDSNQINHKEFITWREFIAYFNDYKEIEERNRLAKDIMRTRQSMQKERTQQQLASGHTDESAEIFSLMEQEKERRLKELPRIRPADQIDITEKQLQLIKDIYDSIPRASTAKEAVHTIDFFIETRKNPQMRILSSTLARDPEGTSRIPKETFQQVFDRMESEIEVKVIDWAMIVEYFTKRGRPLLPEEIQRLKDEDLREREEQEAKKRADEEAERRRMARLMEDLEDKEDYEEFEQRQKSELAAKTLEDGKYKKYRGGDDEDSYGGEDRDEDDEYGDEYQDNEHGAYGRDGYNSDPEQYVEGGRRRNFDSDQNDDFRAGQRNNRGARSATRNRPQSAKAYDERDLKSVKLTHKDYIAHEKAQKALKDDGRYKVTVPKPFGFDIREKTRSKTIRERKVEEMVAAKQIEEDNLIKYQIRSNPIPPEVLIPRYNTLMENNERRRMDVKHNSMAMTKQKEKPFSFYERDKNKQRADPEEYLPHDLKKPQFKANPIPRACSVIIFDQMMKQQEQARQERIRKQTELNYSKAKLPERMQMHEEKKKQMPQQKTVVDDFSFKPRINGLVTAEQFKKQQDKFNSKLNKKKSQMQVTRPKSPNFTKTSTKNLDREYLNEGQQQNQQGPDKFKAALMKSMAKNEEGGTAANPSSTKAMNLAMQRRREELEAKRKKEEEKKKEDEDRVTKQTRMKGQVQAALADRIKNENEKRQNDMEQSKKDAKESFKRNMDHIKDLERKARERPLLVDTIHQSKQTSNLAKIKAINNYMQILKNSNLDPKEHLTDEQKEILQEQEYIDKRKKELGGGGPKK